MESLPPHLNDGLRVLIIDDNSCVRQALELLLLETGDSVLCASDGRKGLKLAADNPIDLIFLDVDMPGMNGFEVGVALRDNQRTASTPLIFISGSVNAQRREKARTLGALDYLQKPFGLQMIKDIVSGLKRK